MADKISTPVIWSAEMMQFLSTNFEDVNFEDTPSRVYVTKKICQYIKNNGLNNPKKKIEIILDQQLRDLFNLECFTYTGLQKALSSHFIKYAREPVIVKQWNGGTWFLSYLSEIYDIELEYNIEDNYISGVLQKEIWGIPEGYYITANMLSPENITVWYATKDEVNQHDKNDGEGVWWESEIARQKTVHIDIKFTVTAN